MTAEESILAACRALIDRPGGTARLADVRDRIGDWMPVDAVTRLLIELDRARVIQLEPEPYRAGLTPQDRAAAVELGGQELHLVRICDVPGELS